MDDPSFYGFPTLRRATVKAAQDCGGPVVDPDARTSEPDPAVLGLLADHMAQDPARIGSAGPVRSAASTR